MIVVPLPEHALAGEKLVIVGEGLTVKVEPLVTGHDPVVFVTTILPVPLAVAGNGTVICVLLTQVTVPATPLIVAVVPPLTKLVPVIVIVVPLPEHALVGEKLVIVGEGLTVNVEPLVTAHDPAVLVTTILPVPLAPAGKFKVIVVGVTVVTGAAVPLIVTVVPPLR